MQARSLAFGIVLGVSACCLAAQARAAAFGSDPTIAEANRLAHDLHSFHAGGPGPLVYSEDDYCKYLRRARDLIGTLDQMAAAGNQFANYTADKLADELGEEREDFYDDNDYYPCWPPLQTAFWPSLGAPLYNATSYSWSGFYIGVNAGFGTGWSRFDFPDGSSGNISLNGISMGATAGFNFQNGPWVPGVVATFNWSDISGNTNRDCSAVCSVTTNWLATVDGRVGYATGNLLPYVKGGVAWGNVEQKIADFSDNTTKTGWNVGAGIEWKFSANWSAKVEYLYVDLGRVSCAETVCGPDSSTPVRDNIFSVGLNWNWGAPGTGWGINSSDARLKHDIVTLGHLENGLTVYRFRYDGDDQVYVGLMAQEVQLVRPDAVIRGDDGYLLVDYGRLGLRMETWEEWVTEREHRSKL